ncbi:MAG: hypothetical protein OXS35_06190 [Dehalococcoidia bacterium]|nr:hypothetical protein [Dehalococcoidia bacterium]
MTDTTQIILAVIGTGVAVLGFLWRLDARMGAIEHRLNSRIDAMEGRMNSRIDALSSRIDNLYQALFSRKDPAA